MEFRTIPSLNNLYEIDETGTIRNISSQKIIKGYVEKNGYVRVKFENKLLPKVIRKGVHQLVAEAFIPNPEKKPFVNHKDSNRSNNNLDNLEWCTHSENMKHAYIHNDVIKDKLQEYRNIRKKPVTNGEITFESISEAGEWLFKNGECKNKQSGISGIYAVLNKKRNSFCCYEWRYLDGI